MFEEINRELEELQQGISRAEKIKSMIASLDQQLGSQLIRKDDLKRELDKEARDLDRISKKGLVSLFYTILGSREEQMEKERQEMLAAKLKYDDILRQIEDTRRQISQLESELSGYSDYRRRFEGLYMKKYEILKGRSDETADKIIRLEKKISALKANLKEITEAVYAGERVLRGLDRVSESLDKAESWGTWDLISRGGLISGMSKHSHIDDARDAASEVQSLLNRFRAELADVSITEHIDIDIDGFTRFADIFFDGLIIDWVVQSRIHDSQDSVNEVRSQVSGVLNKLDRMQDDTKRQIRTLENELSALVSKA